MLNLEEIGQKVTRMNIKVDNIPSTLLLDSCASINIVGVDYLRFTLFKEASEVYGNAVSIKGIGDNTSSALGYIDLNLDIFGRIYKETFLVMRNPGLPGDILLSMGGMGRCGLAIDFADRIIKSKHTGQEAAFILEEANVSENRRHFPEISIFLREKFFQIAIK